MLNRKIESRINKWIENSDRAFLLTGVRQAGKTFVIRKCLEASVCNYVEFNLIDQPEIAQIIEQSKSAEDLILKLSLYSKEEIIPHQTIIFFDEIQKCKEILTRIKFLVDDKRFRYILSGSLLGIEMTGLKSAPVGYLETAEMYPLDFEEFLQVFNVSESIISDLKTAFSLNKPVDEDLHRRIMDIFNLYLIVGGMPSAIEKYRESSNIDDVIQEHNSIIDLYKMDFTQYEQENRKLQISRIYDMIPAELNEKNKRFMIADIKKNLRYDRIQESFTWLWKSGVALGAFNITEPLIPLLLNEKSSLFKMFLSDVGLLTTLYGKACKLKIMTEKTDINKGSIFENFVAQELHAHGFPLYYFNSKKYGELDFVIEMDGKVLPIEVKSGKSYERHSALNNVIQARQYAIEKAFVLYGGNIKLSKDIVYLPIYLTMFIQDGLEDFCDISVSRFML